MIQYRIIERFIATLRNIVNENVWRNYCTSCCNVSIFLVVYYFMSVSWLSHWFLTTSSGKTQFWNYGTTACTGFFLGRFFGSHNLNFFCVVLMCNVVLSFPIHCIALNTVPDVIYLNHECVAWLSLARTLWFLTTATHNNFMVCESSTCFHQLANWWRPTEGECSTYISLTNFIRASLARRGFFFPVVFSDN